MNLSYVLRRASEALRNRKALRDREIRHEEHMRALDVLAPTFVSAARDSESAAESWAREAMRAWGCGKMELADAAWKAAAERYDLAVIWWTKAGALGWIEDAEEQARHCRSMCGRRVQDAVRVEIRGAQA